jgi:hypothetical protein
MNRSVDHERFEHAQRNIDKVSERTRDLFTSGSKFSRETGGIGSSLSLVFLLIWRSGKIMITCLKTGQFDE